MVGTSLPGAATAEDPLRYTFVEMLFALAISQVAVHAADLTSVDTGAAWTSLAAWAHLILSLGVIGASWIGWRQSQSPGMKTQIESIFSRRAVALLLDVLLVILYFILVRSVELKQRDGNVLLGVPSATDDAKWIAGIFAVYVVWDLFADVFSPGCLTASGLRKISQGLRVALVSTAASICCFGLALLIHHLSGDVSDPVRVTLLDVALFCLILSFRIVKVFEANLAVWLDVAGCKAFLNPRAPIKHAYLLLSAFAVLGVSSAALGALGMDLLSTLRLTWPPQL